MAQMEVDQYAPMTLPFFNASKMAEERILEEEQLYLVQLPDLLPCSGNGKIGKMRVYKSGKMEIVVNNQVFSVFNGVQSTFYQEVAKIDEENLTFLGPVKSQLVVAPSI
jgi:hypothetical protein